MAQIYRSVEELVGKTPLLELSRLEKQLNLKAKLLAKLEYFIIVRRLSAVFLS